MSSVDLSEVMAIADRIRNGETVEIRDGEKLVAKVVPEPEGPAKAPFPDWFLNERPPKFETSMLEQFLEDRRKNDW
jgi:antitoxin (DNA-binding transcriptional repressor) of toxin-antitoxin stability system